MEVRIGVVQSPKEIEVELPEGVDADAVTAQVEQAVKDAGVLWLVDRKGRKVGVLAERIAYIEVDAGAEERRVGFGAALR